MSMFLKWTALGSGGLLVLLLVGALGAERLLATEVLIISPKPLEVVKMDRALWEPGQPVAPIYGIPAEQPVRVLLVDQTRLLRPEEDPRLLLLQVDKQRGENPLQVKTMWFVVNRAAMGLGGILTLCFLLGFWCKRKSVKASPVGAL